MEIVRLPVGKQAPVDTDCIRIEQIAGATFKLTASALCSGTDEGESVSIIDGPAFNNAEEAEAAGLAWAANVGIKPDPIAFRRLCRGSQITLLPVHDEYRM